MPAATYSPTKLDGFISTGSCFSGWSCEKAVTVVFTVSALILDGESAAVGAQVASAPRMATNSQRRDMTGDPNSVKIADPAACQVFLFSGGSAARSSQKVGYRPPPARTSVPSTSEAATPHAARESRRRERSRRRWGLESWWPGGGRRPQAGHDPRAGRRRPQGAGGVETSTRGNRAALD